MRRSALSRLATLLGVAALANSAIAAQIPEPVKYQNVDPGLFVYEDDEHFGCKVALDANNAVTTLDYIPLVYAYRRDPNTGIWAESQQIPIAPQVDPGLTCRDLAIRGDTLVIAQKNNVLIYRDNGTQWVANGTIAADPEGSTVALDGTRLAIADVHVTRIYVRNTSAWILQATLPVGTRPIHGPVRFGTDFIVVGRKIFVRSGSKWKERQTLEPWDHHTNIAFGSSLAVGGDHIAVGAPFEQSFPSPFPGVFNGPFGAVYVFRRSGDLWLPEQKLVTSEDLTAYETFGTEVAFSGQTLVVGAGGNNTRADFLSGEVFGFSFHGNGWGEEFRYNRAGTGQGRAGTLALANGTLLVSAPGISYPYSRGNLSFVDLTPAPVITSLTVQPVAGGLRVNASADSRNTGGFEIRYIRFSVDYGPFVDMAPASGPFDSPVESGVSKTITLAKGNRRICAFGIDGLDNRGPQKCIQYLVK